MVVVVVLEVPDLIIGSVEVVMVVLVVVVVMEEVVNLEVPEHLVKAMLEVIDLQDMEMVAVVVVEVLESLVKIVMDSGVDKDKMVVMVSKIVLQAQMFGEVGAVEVLMLL